MLLPLLGLLNPAQAPLWPVFFLRPGCAERCFWPARVRWALFLAGQGALGAVFAGQGALGAVFGARGAGAQNATSPTGSTGYSPGHGRGAVWPVGGCRVPFFCRPARGTAATLSARLISLWALAKTDLVSLSPTSPLAPGSLFRLGLAPSHGFHAPKAAATATPQRSSRRRTGRRGPRRRRTQHPSCLRRRPPRAPDPLAYDLQLASAAVSAAPLDSASSHPGKAHFSLPRRTHLRLRPGAGATSQIISNTTIHYAWPLYSREQRCALAVLADQTRGRQQQESVTPVVGGWVGQSMKTGWGQILGR
jgi:hypothetical protein